MERFLQRYVAAGIQMEVEDILVNGPPWNLRAAIRVHDWSPGEVGDRYNNRAVLFVTSRWGKLRTQEDYEDTQRAAAFDALISGQSPVSPSRPAHPGSATRRGSGSPRQAAAAHIAVSHVDGRCRSTPIPRRPSARYRRLMSSFGVTSIAVSDRGL